MEVNNAAPTGSGEGQGVGFFLGITLLIIFAFFVFYYGIPALRNTGVNVPANQPTTQTQPSGDTNIQVPDLPDKIDVNVDSDK